jgi:hypothetical protein
MFLAYVMLNIICFYVFMFSGMLQCQDPVFRPSIKTRNFVTFKEFLIHLGMHHTC